jgi:hypothetical protein
VAAIEKRWNRVRLSGSLGFSLPDEVQEEQLSRLVRTPGFLLVSKETVLLAHKYEERVAYLS